MKCSIGPSCRMPERVNKLSSSSEWSTSDLPPSATELWTSRWSGSCQQETHAPQQFHSLSRRHVTCRRALAHDGLFVPPGKVNCKMVPWVRSHDCLSKTTLSPMPTNCWARVATS
jgi:hypothetical protein